MSHAQRLFPTPIAPAPVVKTPDVKNCDEKPAYKSEIKHQTLQALLTNTIGNTFYAEEKNILDTSKNIFEKCAKRDPVFFRKALQFARNDGNFRLYPIIGLEILSKTDSAEFKKAFPKVILTPGDLKDFMSILKSKGRGQGGRAIRSVVSEFLRSLSEYHVIKYGGEGKGYSLKDLVATAHPRPNNPDQCMLLRYITHGKNDKKHPVSLIRFPQIAAYEKFKTAKTEAERIRYITEGKLPFEVATSRGTSRAIWNAILPQMPLQTLLKNINTLDEQGLISGKNREYITERLNNPTAIYKAGLLPGQWLKAHATIRNSEIKKVISKALDHSFACIPEFYGKSAIFLDVSGSMLGPTVETGALLGISAHKRNAENKSIFWMFNTNCMIPDDTWDFTRPTLDLIEIIRHKVGGGTNTGACIENLTKTKTRVNNIIMFTDEQQNSGKPFYAALKEYKQKVNPNVRAFIVDVSSASTMSAKTNGSHMAPVNEPNLWYIFGWTDQVLNFISLISKTGDSMVETISNMD